MFQKVDAYAGDPILSLMERFKEDPRSDKVNLSIGLYYNEDGIIPQLKAVAEAEARLNAAPHGASLYLPMEGLNTYRNAIAPLLFGADHAVLAQKRVATIQTLGGSGALKVGADFLKKYFPDSGVWVSDPTWENHVAIFEGAGFKVATYPWFDSETNGVRVDALLEKLNTLPERSIVLLHPCCHNPTGADLTNTQWDAVIEVLKARNLIPFLDIAYQGFGAGMEEDAYAIRAVASAGLPVLVSNSFSKIFSLYGERVGGLSVVCEDAEAAGRVLGQLKATVRRIYSSPPNFGAQVVATVLGDEQLKASWLAEVVSMRKRILSMRQELVNVLKEAVPGHNFDYLLKQRGMFSYTGLSAAQVERLREEFGVYLIASGRMCVAGLNASNVHRVAQAFAAVM
ncbi:aromatic amino acid transaminase [Enterobacter cloacae]|uniref:Aminotransferase n=1 Tax=Enterobacter cloacae subsp. cloacae (strain ATCC 13047 / DSM 30054 / NBRC 13535 / NCTC 10005 / WDCM 00083 / NCDC 279-56) TaxID=716541 RepID=A0A0H3CDH0_ENTCC|nr:aromatic amino acid transaminase [Enterobacter cloacae]MBP7742922.1 aromatic amino acid transaminase [Enterobacter sp.]MBW4208457.1 aromatic amino acid transaminase [Enterobacter cloacae subsp. cloacae]ADF59878.1 aromatic amino acid aminotransferase [Enterobacter cloacae subsp. cloacae ATCC 13047]KGB13029.1 aromatic-amino-acid aminotransferase [Enterobacter cloacae]MBW4231934.1 aromatic amino acid transaminase [Enterobacter cloacae subsp. cloacae]